MTNEYSISLATPNDVPGIIALQEPNLPVNGGALSVRQPADWFTKAILEKSVVVARRDGKVVGYVLGTSLAMSVKGQARRFPNVRVRSAFLLIATINGPRRSVEKCH